jgi:hypothetical protein
MLRSPLIRIVVNLAMQAPLCCKKEYHECAKPMASRILYQRYFASSLVANETIFARHSSWSQLSTVPCLGLPWRFLIIFCLAKAARTNHPQLIPMVVMTAATRARDVAEVDAYIAEAKTVTQALPQWKGSSRVDDYTAEWPIVDANGALISGNRLVFTCRKTDLRWVTIALLYRNKRVYGIDLDPPGRRKPNPPDAGRLGLPSMVSGAHFHLWTDNRNKALEIGIGEVPYRRPCPVLMSKLPRALAHLAQDVNLSLTPEQLSFDVPPQGNLFAIEGGP